MLDLRDFNIHWKRLPPLPRLWDYVYALSYLNGDGSSYIWQQTHSDSSEAEGWKLGALRKGEDKEMNSLNCEWNWEYVSVNTRPPWNLNFDIMSQRIPLYVEIQLLHEFIVNDAIVMKRLYMRCPVCAPSQLGVVESGHRR
jgi:hypothetical protein